MSFGSGPVFQNYKQQQKWQNRRRETTDQSHLPIRVGQSDRGESEMALAPGISRKLKKVLESRTETPDLIASLKTLSTFYEDNTPHARRNLRSTIEKRALSINLDFLQASNAAQQVTLSLFSSLLSLFLSLSFLFY